MILWWVADIDWTGIAETLDGGDARSAAHCKRQMTWLARRLPGGHRLGPEDLCEALEEHSAQRKLRGTKPRSKARASVSPRKRATPAKAKGSKKRAAASSGGAESGEQDVSTFMETLEGILDKDSEAGDDEEGSQHSKSD